MLRVFHKDRYASVLLFSTIMDKSYAQSFKSFQIKARELSNSVKAEKSLSGGGPSADDYYALETLVGQYVQLTDNLIEIGTVVITAKDNMGRSNAQYWWWCT